MKNATTENSNQKLKKINQKTKKQNLVSENDAPRKELFLIKEMAHSIVNISGVNTQCTRRSRCFGNSCKYIHPSKTIICV